MLAQLSATIPRPVINADNDMITGGVIGWIIWIYHIIKGTTNRTNNIS
jgi:hypothetical protein